jgi:hypothetical protein
VWSTWELCAVFSNYPFSFLAILGIEPRASRMLGRCSVTRATPPALLFCILFLRQGLTTFYGLDTNLQSSDSTSSQVAGIPGMCHLPDFKFSINLNSSKKAYYKTMRIHQPSTQLHDCPPPPNTRLLQGILTGQTVPTTSSGPKSLRDCPGLTELHGCLPRDSRDH